MSATVEPVSPQVVGNAFVQQYYHILHQTPALVHRFYQDVSKLGRPEEDGSMSITTTMKDINEKILSLNYDDFKAEIKSIDAQDSFHGGVSVLVTGQMSRKDKLVRNFTQAFFLAPQEIGYFVLNDMFRYVDVSSFLDLAYAKQIGNDSTPIHEQNLSPVLETDQEVAAPVEENGEKSVDDTVVNETVVVEEVPLAVVVEEVPLTVVVEEVPLAGVVEEVPLVEVVLPVEIRLPESESKTGVPKRSYASIVMVMKQSGRTVPSPAPRRIVPKIQEQPKPVASGAEIPISGSEAAEDGNNHEGEADGYSIYIKGLPMNATPSILDEEFKKFGTIKSGGIQVRSNKGFCFGFVEFESPDSVVKALEASPVVIGGRHAVVEEKRSTNSRAGYNNRGGRMQGGRGEGGGGGSGFRTNNNNGNGRGYARGGGDFNNNNGNGNNNRYGGNRYHNYQRGMNNNRPNGGGGMNKETGGATTAAATVPSVSASA